MISIHNISIKYKLVLMQVLTSFIVLAICCVFFVITDIKSYKERKADSISAIAQVIGSNSVSAIQFADNASATAKLNELNVETDILNATIVDKNKAVFATYTKKGAPVYIFPSNRFNTDRIEFNGQYLFLYHKIMNNKEVLGTVCLQVGLTQLQKITNEKIQLAGLLLFIGIMLALLIAMIFQGSISSPIFNLVQIMQKVKSSDNYKSRAPVNGSDELNTLSLVFNDMLEEIERREIHIKQRTSELEVANSNFQNLIQSAPDAIVTIDESGIISNWNQEAETMFGWKEAEAIGKTLTETIIPEIYREAHTKGMSRFLATGTGKVLNKSIELSGLKKDGSEFPIELKISSSIVGGKYVFIGFIRDIKERKKAEEKILLLNKELEQKLEELEISNKEMESFSYSVSHDLRAPIRAINGFSSIIQKQYSAQFDEEGKSLLATISGEAKRMGQLIDDLLAFSRLGKKEIQKSKVDMTELAKEVVAEIIKYTEGPNKAKITIDNLPAAFCDRSLIRQVFVNLISNSVKYSGQKAEPVISIGSYTEMRSTVYFIKDNGAGFDMAFYDKLFGVFQRLHSPEDFTGTGIGLAIVKRIIVRHGGKVWGEGKVGEGAVFYFSLPF
ncbi:MAG: PAS domain S-box protein [Bacteroidota bacterium]